MPIAAEIDCLEDCPAKIKMQSSVFGNCHLRTCFFDCKIWIKSNRKKQKCRQMQEKLLLRYFPLAS